LLEHPALLRESQRFESYLEREFSIQILIKFEIYL
jgi:hypothetical protein